MKCTHVLFSTEFATKLHHYISIYDSASKNSSGDKREGKNVPGSTTISGFLSKVSTEENGDLM